MTDTKIKATVTFESRSGKIIEQFGYGDTREEALKYASRKGFENITVRFENETFEDVIDTRTEDEIKAEHTAWAKLHYGK